MSYSSNAWQAAADRCTQFADEGACLARISRNVPVTIVPGLGALGQVGSALTTLAPRGTEIRAIQTALIHAGALTIRTADGLISSTSSPTLAAIRSWATSNGLSSTGTARTADSGLVIPTALLNRILGLTAIPATPEDPDAPIAPAASATLPGFTAASRRGWVPWVIGGAVVLGMGAFLMGAGTGARVASNPRPTRHRRARSQRRMRRNSDIDAAREDFGYAIRSARYFNKIGSREQAREYAAAAEQAAMLIWPLSETQQKALDGVRQLVANRRRRSS